MKKKASFKQSSSNNKRRIQKTNQHILKTMIANEMVNTWKDDDVVIDTDGNMSLGVHEVYVSHFISIFKLCHYGTKSCS